MRPNAANEAGANEAGANEAGANEAGASQQADAARPVETPSTAIARIGIADITGLVLAGGRGARMGGVDKGLQLFHGIPLAQHALRRLAPQVGGGLMVNANRHLDEYAAFGVPVYPDAADGCASTGADACAGPSTSPSTSPSADRSYAGPLAGILAGLSHASTPYLAVVPCDSPLFPTDLVRRLGDALLNAQADVAIASAPDASGLMRPQPVFCLLRTNLRASLTAFVQSGGRKVQAWTSQCRTVIVPFEPPATAADAFSNANTAEELRALEGTAMGLDVFTTVSENLKTP